jgi:hypothetical protein
MEDVLFLLQGLASTRGVKAMRVERDTDSSRLWYILEYESGLLAFAQPTAGGHRLQLLRLFDQKQQLLLELNYEGMIEQGEGCSLPRRITIKGEELGGTVTLRYDHILSRRPFPASTFKLTIPPHFSRERLD